MTQEYLFGVDLGGTSVKLGLFTAALAVPVRTADKGRLVVIVYIAQPP